MAEKTQTDIDIWIEKGIRALKAEIEAVREFPATDRLHGGQLVGPAGEKDEHDYRFQCSQPSIRFAEELRIRIGDKDRKAIPLEYEKGELILRTDDLLSGDLEDLPVEWENDFVLQRTLRELERLADAEGEEHERIRALFEPEGAPLPGPKEIEHDGLRNESQQAAIRKALQCRTLYIWGPPGTGKTATLGYVIANFLKQRKRVLFASNTNRSVDVGLLSTLHALDTIGFSPPVDRVTRFGELALDADRLPPHQFDYQMEQLLERRREEASDWVSWLDREKDLSSKEERLKQDGKSLSATDRAQLEMVREKIETLGGREELEETAAAHLQINERSRLRRCQLVATTLAKVCTSELFYQMEFDAVVIDEGSMAGLPWLMALASRARWHRVIVGDPMQLPPIAISEKPEATEMLERDIFTTVSGAETTDELFDWHDKHPDVTAFFDTQYRMTPGLARVVSNVFYQGRLKSVEPDVETETEDATGSPRSVMEGSGQASRPPWHVIDTSKYRPSVVQPSGERGFKPVNQVHEKVLIRLIGNMLRRGITPDSIGVMVPFRSSVQSVRSALWDEGIRDVEIGTIHTFQGREKPYIIFDLVMSGEWQNGRVRHYSVRPLDEQKNGMSVMRLLNVAFSRSQEEFMVLADMGHIRQVYGEKFLGRLLDQLKSPA
ncbi:MAG: AAA domain-containing protein [Balneolaceae bacterium]